MEGAILMAGTSNITGLESIIFADNASFDGTERDGRMTTDGQLWVGASSGTRVRLGGITSPDGSVTVGYTAPNITLRNSGAGTVPGGFANLGITLSGGTFSITSASGAALSGTNKGYVSLRSTVTPGTIVTIPVTANQTFIDDTGASTIIGNLFGLPTGVAYTEDIPFAIYAVADSTETSIAFGISRYWAFNTSPIAARLGKTGSAVADLTGSMFLFENPTVADYASQSLLRIGWIRMRMSAVDDWTVQTLSATDGLRPEMIKGSWNFPTGVFGATAGSYFLANGGTAPTFNASSAYVYALQENGFVQLLVKLNNGGADGVGAVEARLSTPYADTTARVNGIAYGTCTPFTAGVMIQGTGSAYYSRLLLTTTGGITTNIDWVGTKELNFAASQFVSVNV